MADSAFWRSPFQLAFLCWILLLPVSGLSQVGAVGPSVITRILPRAFTPVVNPHPQGSETTDFPLYLINPSTPGHAQAKCNDGSPAVYGYLPAKKAESRKWMVFLEGGSHCSNLFSCVQRWLESPERMSTLFTRSASGVPLSQKASQPLSGIFLDTGALGLPANQFREEFHQVWINYCSSDSWHGDGKYIDAQTTAAHNGVEDLIDAWSSQLISTPGFAALGQMLARSKASFLTHFCDGTECRILFRGTEIIDAVIDDLVRHRGMRRPEVFLLAGSSAGSMGVRQNIDRLQRKLTRQWPNLQVLGAADSGHFAAGGEVLKRSSGQLPLLSNSCQTMAPPPAAPRPSALPAQVLTGSAFWGNSLTDFSCFRQEYGGIRPKPLDALAFTALDSCRDHGVLLPSVSSPLFIFQTYRDRIYVGDSALNNINCNQPAGIERAVTHASYHELLDSGRAVFAVDTSMHTSMQSPTFFNVTRRDPSVASVQLSHYNILWNWVQTLGVYNHAVMDCPPGCAIACGQQRCP